MRWVRRVAAGVAAAAAVCAVLLALDVRGWQRAVDSGDAGYAIAPRTASWSFHARVPGDPARSLLALDDDLALRRGLQRFHVAQATPEGYDNGMRQAASRARAEVALADVVLGGTRGQASQAGNLMGVLVFDADDADESGSADERAQSAWNAAVRADPGNTAAKYNLELLLRRSRLIGTREGPASGSGARGASRRGAGAGTPGRGY